MNVLSHEELLDHYKFPHNRKVIENPTFSESIYNPSCGDKISITGVVADGVLTDIGFQGSGCVLSQAAASMLTVEVKGKSIAHIQSLDAVFMQQQIGMEVGPTRLKCATLALEVLKRAAS